MHAKLTNFSNSRGGRNVLRVIGLTVGAVMIAAGVGRGELTEIMRKGVRICLECIGIG